MPCLHSAEHARILLGVPCWKLSSGAKDTSMRNITLFITTALLLGCTAPAPYSWQDTRQPVREDATDDLEKCRSYASRQYQPGTPMGESYLKAQEVLKDQAGGQSASKTEDMNIDSNGQWRPDRSPFPRININESCNSKNK